MGLFGKSAQQKRIDELAFEVGSLEEALAVEQKRSREKGRLASELLAERDAARIERDTAQRERDGYRIDAIKFRALKSNLIPGGPKAKAKRDAAAVGAGL
jgi:hypothetical protein